ncbi:MAG TPA: hypothetical protein VM434_18660 [Beijerinckiaceae bacterium]|nr:hypothetical protein [Beijerinckiaceae bacterium]
MRWAALVTALMLLGVAAPAVAEHKEIEPAERRILPWDADIPGCDDTLVLAEITTRFAEREARFWNSALRLLAYENIRPTAWRPWRLDHIPRRFCQATAHVSDGRKRTLFYTVQEDLGTIGSSWGVDWCVVGIDRHWDHAPWCRMARP